MKYDCFVLESTGHINDNGDGYGKPIVDRLKEMGYNPYLFHLKSDYSKLDEIPRGIPLILSGGMTPVTNDEQWLNEVKWYVSNVIIENQIESDEYKTPILGICFGAQLISEVIQKDSVHFLDNPRIGKNTVQNIKSQVLFNGISNDFEAYSFHYNQIQNSQLYAISKVETAETNFVNAFENYKLCYFGTQFHPEFKREEFNTLLNFYKDYFKEEFNLNLNHYIDKSNTEIDNSIIIENFIKFASNQRKTQA